MPTQLSSPADEDLSRSLKRELVRAQEEIKRIQSVPLVIGQFMEAIDQKSTYLVLTLRSLANTEQYRHCAILHRFQLRGADIVNP